MKLIFFDFDGVLVDTLPIAFGINSEVDPGLSLEKYKSFFEGNIHDAIASGAKKHIPDFDEKYSLRARELKVPKKLKDLLLDLSTNFILTIVSSSSTYLIKEILKREDIESCFQEVFGSDAHTSKVEKIKKILEKYKVEPKDTVFITDTVGDVLEARKCEVESIAVTWGFHEPSTLGKVNPHKIVDTPEELEKVIKELL